MMLRNRSLLVILALSVLLRVGVALYLGDATPPAKDETSYALLAARVATGHGFTFAAAWYPFTPAGAPTAHWSFLYTAFVAAVYVVFGPHPLAVRLVQAVIAGAFMPWLAWRLFWRTFPAQALQPWTLPRLGWTIHHFPPLLAALLTASYAYFVLYAAMIQTEAFFLLAILWSLERSMTLQQTLLACDARAGGNGGRSQRAPWLFAACTLGIGLGMAALLRQSILPWVAVLCAWLIVSAWLADRSPLASARSIQALRGARLSSAVLAVTSVLLLLLAAILPFTLRNYRVYGEFLLLNSNAGYAMYSAQHPLHGVTFNAYVAAPLPTDFASLPVNEAQWDRALMMRGIQFILADPGRYLLLSASRAVDYFEFWPKESSSLLFNVGRVASFTLLLPFMLFGVWIALKRDHCGAWRLLLLFVVFYSLLHIFTWAMPRYRLPVDAVLLLFAAAALADLATHILPAHN
ncbi:MAG: hypothetical protein IAE81_02255 [Caldilineaceae bacterium]|nr:hypothetical protein [Caldilineaceae bacterium]